MGETIGTIIVWLIIWLVTVPLIVIGAFDLDYQAARLVYVPCALIGLGLPLWGAVDALFPSARNSRAEKIVGGIGAGAGLLVGLVFACAMLLLTVGYAISVLGVRFLGIPAFGFAKLLGFEVEPSMHWIVGDVIAAVVVGTMVVGKAMGHDKRKTK